ncbi:hypothetical protein N0V93_008073 [Gnomoniopsis smithogilvyi]|uniref:Zn(2)-C6 fungal-type domain-containing protein n=1 Tax=Gnomoniopsis smithogilvyi TaxID=1191159 RepID=A0A9W9CTJ4_9PEZI|nr:hypothetical protein N0V93_008073 [Gnomoniopsis smithogilvyi]
MPMDGTGKKQYTPILPAPSSSGSSSTPPSHRRASELPPKRQKRAGTGRFACDACRARKSACDSRRPTCSTCIKRQSQCVYTPRPASGISPEEQVELNLLRQQKDGLGKQHGGSIAADVLESVRTLPEDQALLLFHRLRASPTNSSVSLQWCEANKQGLTIDPHLKKTIITSNDIRPASTLSVEYELMIRHPLLYPVVSPETNNILSVASAAQLSSLGRRDPAKDLSSLLQPTGHVEPSKSPIPTSDQRSPSPNHSDLCDARLALFDVRNWLQVPVRSEFAARAISFYLVTEHPVLGLFDVDLFLDDLVARRTDFCSPLLLCAVLSVACQGYTAIDPEAASFSHDFFVEAERLYSEEKTGGPQYESAVMTIAAARLLCGAATGHGWVRIASRYVLDGLQMAHENGLLSVPRRDGARLWLDGNVNNVRAAAYAAWGTFCTTVFYGSRYWDALIDIQPWLPIPGTIIDRDDGSTVPFRLPPYMGESFTQLCRLAPLINRIVHQRRLATNDGVSLKVVEETYMMLLQWADSLPIAAGPGRNMSPHVAIMHIQFHTAVMDLFRPLLQQNPKQRLEFGSFNAENRTVEDVCLASINQLKHLVLVFRTRYAGARSCFLWHTALLYVANDCVSESMILPGNKTEENDVDMTGANIDGAKQVIWFMACVDGYKALAPQFPIVSGIVQGLLSMGIEQGMVTAAEGRAYMEEVEVDAIRASHVNVGHPGKPWLTAQSFAARVELPERQDHFIIDLNRAMADPTAASIEALSQRFNEVVMLDELSASKNTATPM